MYCNLVWGSTYVTHLEPLFKLQKKAVRLIHNSDYLSHTNNLFLNSKLLKLEDIYNYQLGIFMFKNEISVNFERQHSYNTRNRNELLPQFNRLSLGQHSVFYRGPKFWNEIPIRIKNCTSIQAFKYHLKLYLLSKYNV